MRGKRYNSGKQSNKNGITPAGAGKTKGRISVKTLAWDHPRRCGENKQCFSVKTQYQGSPPQVRGKPPRSEGSRDYSGITPAGAGKTKLRNYFVIRKQDHPRRCGENQIIVKQEKTERGSPPQVRGKLPIDLNGIAQQRITPAGAGKTRSARNCNPTRKDHPRRCGENLS